MHAAAGMARRSRGVIVRRRIGQRLAQSRHHLADIDVHGQRARDRDARLGDIHGHIE